MVRAAKDLWSLVLDRNFVDPQELADAIVDQLAHESHDYRTRLLIHDGLDALGDYWGKERLQEWLTHTPFPERLETIHHERFERRGFPFLKDQIVETTRPETILQLLQELGSHVHRPTKVFLGGSGSLILTGHLSRRTQDIDFSDEVPQELRALGSRLDDIARRYRLGITHFQSHYLPSGWEKRVHSMEPMGKMQVFLVDVYDVILSKLFSAREKDQDDLRDVMKQLDKEVLTRRLKVTCQPLLAVAKFREQACHNWNILYREELPA